MISLIGRFIAASELPPNEGFPPNYSVKLLVGHEPLNLVTSREVFDQLAPLAEDTEVKLVLGWRLVKLRELGGKGNAYRLRILEVLS